MSNFRNDKMLRKATENKKLREFKFSDKNEFAFQDKKNVPSYKLKS